MTVKTKAFQDENILETAQAVMKRGPTCDHCLGRQLAHVSTGMTNDERGKLIRKMTGMKKVRGKCIVCGDIFDKLEDYADKASSRLGKIEFSTFLVGTVMSPGLVSSEESLWEDVGIEYCEPLKSELNRELGKLIYDRIKKEVSQERPDVLVMLNLKKERVELDVSSFFVKGCYRKLVRGIPQTKWEKYDETVEDIIASPFMLASGGSGHSLHAAGREDIDARCLGCRPFVLEIKEPRKRSLDLVKMGKDVAKSKKVEVSGLEPASKNDVIDVKSMRNDKSYSVVVSFEKPVKGIEKIKNITAVEQRTPSRVSHRRADLVRKRKVISLSWKKINNKKFELQIKGEAGLYIKELVTGDSGRTKPSFAEVLGNPAKVESLDVTRIWE